MLIAEVARLSNTRSDGARVPGTHHCCLASFDLERALALVFCPPPHSRSVLFFTFSSGDGLRGAASLEIFFILFFVTSSCALSKGDFSGASKINSEL